MELLIVTIPAIIAAVGGCVSAYLTSKSKTAQDEAAKDAKDYRQQREKLDKAKWKVLLATMQGVTVLLHQAKGEKLNGNVEDALDNIHVAHDELTDIQSELYSKA